MAITISDVMAECKNHFVDVTTPFIEGEFVIVSGVITPSDALAAGDYIAITGSRLNDGVYLPVVDGSSFTLPDTEDEVFTGYVWILHPPRRFLTLVSEISAFAATNPPAIVTSESFGSYSRSVALNKQGTPATWVQAFADQLRPYRRMFKVVPL